MMKKITPDTLEAIIEHTEAMHKQTEILLNVSLELDQVYAENKHKDELITQLSDDVEKATDQIKDLKTTLSEEQDDNSEKEEEIQKLKSTTEDFLHDIKERDETIAKLNGNKGEPVNFEEFAKKFITIKSSDVIEFLPEEDQNKLRQLLDIIAEGRQEAGKQAHNQYLTINVDESYSNQVANIMKAYNHCN
ncbi:hypothetical protein M3Y14_34350 (plasmid) [Bacillus thuringiensis]|uniref:hypothetical protein n=1 Tax=Bacillus thuringiensis TaxID=1428 RepID=UPI002224A219|nr:hypothetical protein [Bacillus thuringiensis]UYX56065.1 hypothetical protein M3Y14_34350 [Bacillus thuringiensis]